MSVGRIAPASDEIKIKITIKIKRSRPPFA